MAIKSITALLLLAPFLLAPVTAQQGPIGGDTCDTTTYDPNTDYFTSKITVDNAALFKVRYEKNYKVVSTTAVGNVKDYVLVQCGTPAPPTSMFTDGTVFVTIPVKNAASLATTALAYIEMLGRRSALKLVDTEGLVSSPCVQMGLDSKDIVGLEDKNMTLRAEQFNGADVVFSTYGSEPGTENKTVITSEVSDPGPLNRAEWLEFYSTFFNLEEPAQALTASINNNYNCFKAAANAKPDKPIVVWSSYDAPSKFNNNTASWILSGAPYKEILTADAGGELFNGTTSSIFTSAADFAAALKDVDVVIDETNTGADMNSFLQNYQLAADADYKFLKNKAVFREDGIVNPNDGRDWFASAVVMNDAVLQDIIRAVHPDVLPADVPYNWIRNIAKDESMNVLTSADCTAPDAAEPLPDRAIVCSTMKAGGKGTNAASKTMAGALTAVLGLLAVALTL